MANLHILTNYEDTIDLSFSTESNFSWHLFAFKNCTFLSKILCYLPGLRFLALSVSMTLPLFQWPVPCHPRTAPDPELSPLVSSPSPSDGHSHHSSPLTAYSSGQEKKGSNILINRLFFCSSCIPKLGLERALKVNYHIIHSPKNLKQKKHK